MLVYLQKNSKIDKCDIFQLICLNKFKLIKIVYGNQITFSLCIFFIFLDYQYSK